AEERDSISIRPGAFHAFRRRNSQNACDGRADVVDVLRVEGCDANAASGDRVDAELVAQPIHLRSRKARIRKHPPLAQDEGKVAVCPASLQSVDQALPHLLDAVAHLGKLLFPELAQLAAAQHARDEGTAMGWWVRVVGANRSLELTENARA